VFGALSGAVHAVDRHADAIGTFTVALATGVGGGILRDVLLGHGPPVALIVPVYLPAVALVSLVALLFASWLAPMTGVIEVIDALLLGLWTVLGAERAAAHGLASPAVIFLGTVTATGGGVLRDILSGQAPALFGRGELKISAAFVAALVFIVASKYAHVPARVAEVATVVIAATLRLLAMHLHLTAPGPVDLPGWWRRARRRG